MKYILSSLIIILIQFPWIEASEIDSRYAQLSFLSREAQKEFSDSQFREKWYQIYIHNPKPIIHNGAQYSHAYVFFEIRRNLPKSDQERASIAKLLSHETPMVRYCSCIALNLSRDKPRLLRVGWLWEVGIHDAEFMKSLL